MARIVGVFENSSMLHEVVAQLRLNGVAQLTVVDPGDDLDQSMQQLRAIGTPDAQVAEYRARLGDQRWLLLVQLSDIDLPMAQRALRNGQALDVDILPDSTAV